MAMGRRAEVSRIVVIICATMGVCPACGCTDVACRYIPAPSPITAAWSTTLAVHTDDRVAASAVTVRCSPAGWAHVLTAGHVVRHGRDLYINSNPVVPIKVHAPADLATAIVAVDGLCTEARVPATDPSPGDEIYAVGSAHGIPGSVTAGVVVQSTMVSTGAAPWRALWVTAPLIAGQSGGGIYDRRGYLVGIISHARQTLHVPAGPIRYYAVHTSEIRSAIADLERHER